MNRDYGKVITACMLVPSLALSGYALAQEWPGFRGDNASGISDKVPAPVTWDLESGENILWTRTIPGLAHSSPAVWGDRVFVTTAASADAAPELKVGLYGSIESVSEDTPHNWIVYALDKGTGELVWERVAHTGVPKVKRHPKSTHANPTPATDGAHVVSFFGSEGLYCYDWSGELLWKKDLGTLDAGFYMVKSAQWGFASSPIIHDGKVIVQCDVLGDSFLAAFDVETGDELWRTRREDVPTWSTPSIYEAGAQTRIAVNGYRHIGGYDLATGREVWRLEGGGDIPVPTPVVSGDLMYFHSAHGRMSPIYAVQTTAVGDISLDDDQRSNDAIAWSIERGGGYMATALVYDGLLYNLQNNGRLTCYDATTGEEQYSERLGETGTAFSASPVASGGHLYFTSEDGDVFVLKAGPAFNVIATNSMNDICMATPAISEGTLFVRTRQSLVAISEQRGD